MSGFQALATVGQGTMGSVFNTLPTTISTPGSSPGAPVAGTSAGNPGNSGNALSVNLGGVNLNYDLGPSASTVASQAYGFLNNSFNTDTAFVGGAITGGQQFLNGIISPVLGMAADQQDFNTSQLPDMFSNLNNQNFQLGSLAIGAEANTANAEITQANATARSASSGGGLCYITTAVCGTLGLPDDCHHLSVLRAFRDGYMQATAIRRDFVARYYRTAPALVARMRKRRDSASYIGRLYERFILPAVMAIDAGQLDRAYRIYRHLVYTVQQENPTS